MGGTFNKPYPRRHRVYGGLYQLLLFAILRLSAEDTVLQELNF